MPQSHQSRAPRRPGRPQTPTTAPRTARPTNSQLRVSTYEAGREMLSPASGAGAVSAASLRGARAPVIEGRVVVPREKRKPVDLSKEGLEWQTQFSSKFGSQDEQAVACFRASWYMAEKFLKKKRKPGHDGGPGRRIQIATSESRYGRIKVDPKKALQGHKYVDAMLDAGKPVVVGVSYKNEDYNIDKITDHFVCIYGRKYNAKGEVFYPFFDPVASSRGRGTSAFKVNAANHMMYQDPDPDAAAPSKRLPYEVSMVRRYDE